jgi:hypothetical protein
MKSPLFDLRKKCFPQDNGVVVFEMLLMSGDLKNDKEQKRHEIATFDFEPVTLSIEIYCVYFSNMMMISSISKDRERGEWRGRREEGRRGHVVYGCPFRTRNASHQIVRIEFRNLMMMMSNFSRSTHASDQ